MWWVHKYHCVTWAGAPAYNQMRQSGRARFERSKKSASFTNSNFESKMCSWNFIYCWSTTTSTRKEQQSHWWKRSWHLSAEKSSQLFVVLLCLHRWKSKAWGCSDFCHDTIPCTWQDQSSLSGEFGDAVLQELCFFPKRFRSIGFESRKEIATRSGEGLDACQWCSNVFIMLAKCVIFSSRHAENFFW